MNELLFNSEFDNAIELMGFDGFEKAIKTATPAQKVVLAKKAVNASNNNLSRGSRRLFEKHFNQLPERIKFSLLKGDLRLADYTVYSTKQVNSKTIKMFESQDDKEVGVRNISNQKLPKNTVMLVTGIYLLAGVVPEAAPIGEGHKIIQYGSIADYPAIANGEFSFKANKKQIIPENQSNRKFITDNKQTVELGYFKLDNPRFIYDEETIEFTLELGTSIGTELGTTYVYVGLDGTCTTP